jgi:hypothetical protein
MPLISPPRTFIDVPVTDRTPGVKQQARWNSLQAQQNPETGVLQLNVGVLVQPYADDNGAYGERLFGKGINPWNVLLVGNNDCAVNPDTGEVLYLRTTETDAQWVDLLNSKPEPLILQGDWFLGYMAVHITPLLQSFMQAADRAPFNKFG